MTKLAKAVALFGASSLLGTATQVVKGKLSAVVLGSEGVGVLGQLTNLWSLFSALSGLSFFNGIIQRVAAGARDGDQVMIARQFSTSLVFLTLFSCVASLTGAALARPISHLIFNDHGGRSGLVALILLSIPFGVTAQTYRSLLTGHALVKPVVKAQVAGDVLGVIVFIPMLYGLGLWGAVAAFGLLQLFKLGFQLVTVARSVGRDFLLPDLNLFDWKEVRKNVAFGANGILMQAMSIGSALVITRLIITSAGLNAAGIYNAAWKVATLYFGAIYAAAGGYFLPMLVAAKADNELSERVNETATLYLYLLPPAIITLVVAGPELVTLLFTREFHPAAVLMALMLPADMLRITAETTGLVYLARRKLFAYSAIYAVWVTAFLCISYFMLRRWGVVGVAGAYLLAHVINFLLIGSLVRRDFGLRMAPSTRAAFYSGCLACMAASAVALGVASFPIRLLAGATIGLAWLGLSWRESGFRELASKTIQRLTL